MATRRSTVPKLDINVTNAVEEQAAKFVRGTTPWIVWLAGLPLAAVCLMGLARLTHLRDTISWGLAIAAVVLSWLVWKVTSARGKVGRWHHVINTAGALLWLAAVVTWGWDGALPLPGVPHDRGSLLIAYALGGLTLTLAWNIRYTTHHDAAEDVLSTSHFKGPKRVDGAYVIRVLAGRVPALRAGAEKAGKVVPALAAPWREPAREVNGTKPAAIEGAPAPDVAADAAAQARAQAMWATIRKDWRDFAAHKVPELNGAQIKPLDIKPWRIRSEVVLVRGVHTPKVITDHRELLASQTGLPQSSIIAKPNPRNGRKVFLDFVLEDVLATVRYWPGPTAAGQSIAAAATRFGVYEDRQYAERFGPAVTSAMAKANGMEEQNLSHMLSEGMNGAGKSNAQRILITDGTTRLDIEDWLIDTVKKTQTFGHLGQAVTWFATTVPEARAMVRFLADVIIPARADYLGTHGFDNWEPGCGLPYLRVTVEEGGIVANELDKLDHVLNSARSTGTEICLSVQRAHHALVDTNVRAAFGDTLTFGAKNLDDVFAMPDEMKEAGADPSLWANKQPGMAYYAASELDFDRQMMPVRCFKVDAAECREIIAAHAPARDAWIAENCPDWATLLAAVDTRGVYAKRTTGAQILATIEAAEGRKAAKASELPAEEVPAMPPLHLVGTTPGHLDEEEEIVEGELVDDDGEDLVSAEELDLPDELGDDVALGVGEDADIDPRKPLPPLDPADDVHFGRPPRADVPREEALEALRVWLARKGHGFEFAPRDIYDEVCPLVGKSAAWVRGELSITLANEGLVQANRAEGRYMVTSREVA